MLPKEAILEFQALYKKVYRKEISYEQALEKGTNLIRLFQLIYKPIPKNWIKQNKREEK